MNWLRNIARLGLEDADEYQKRRGIILSNYISITLCGALLLLFIVRRIVFASIPGGVDLYLLLVGLVSFSAPIFFNKAGMTTLSRLLLCYIPVGFMWYAYIYLMRKMSVIDQAEYDTMRIFLLAFSFIPFLLLDNKKWHLLILGIMPTFLSLVFLDSILGQFGLGIAQRGLPGESYSIMGIRTFVAYFVISISCFLFQSIITFNDDLNKRILVELKKRSDEIRNRNKELVQSQEKLNEINLHLEDLVTEKTRSIQEQNELILKYAHANAHDVRGPVARLLGLIQISRLKTDLDYPWFFEKVEHEAKRVDEIITGIAKDLHEIDQQKVQSKTKSSIDHPERSGAKGNVN